MTRKQPLDKLTPAQRQWRTINNAGPGPRLTERQRLAHLYRALQRQAFGEFAERNAVAMGAAHEYRVAAAAFGMLVQKLETGT